jgi:PIN domain nuclease of toxin-antitoxin system
VLPIVTAHVIAHVAPEPPTRDPFDRLLLAQCKTEARRLVTIDRALVDHPLAAKS